ncbi:hypothetical protein PENFLA_c140G09866 [Penicillium flavigenum]|uniref:Cation-transporting P-type ATPase C-terminal domain-containing protein n=1 Tax=Penicillium flavigenum TaxID=254877 RepID=A0A1V6S353_9EURO|nr:hypothetical protein PENFLA_c140G09866 [Penicillium flavigenum]
MGSATTICSDKTGTLTENKMSVVAAILGTTLRFGDVLSSDHAANETGAEVLSAPEFTSMLSPSIKSHLLQSIVLNSTAFEGEHDGAMTYIGSKTETALLSFAREQLGLGPVGEERANVNIMQMFPFDSSRKCMAVVVRIDNGKYRMLVKGAAEILLSQSTQVVRDPTNDQAEAPLSDEKRTTLDTIITNYASRSLRCIALVNRDFEQWPPRGAPTHEDAKAIAQQCGIYTAGGISIEGPQLRQLSPRQMNVLIPSLQVMARSSPDDKNMLVRQLKKLGETVTVTGDGTNDAQALKTADVGFAMGVSGTEVAKEASDIILMDDNFASIVKAMAWGQTVNDAVKRFLQFQITVNITAVALTFVSAVAGNDEHSVLSAVQLLWVNLIMDTFAALELATDPPSPHVLERRPDPKSAPLITLTMWKMIIGQAVYELVVTLILNFAGQSIFPTWDNGHMKTVVFNTFVFMQIFNHSRRVDNRLNIMEGIFRNKWFIGIQLIIIGGQILIIVFGGAAFSVHHLDQVSQWAVSLILGILAVPVAVIIRLVPDAFIHRLIPHIWSHKKGPELSVSREGRHYEWNLALEEIRTQLSTPKICFLSPEAVYAPEIPW